MDDCRKVDQRAATDFTDSALASRMPQLLHGIFLTRRSSPVNKALQYFCANSRPPANNRLLNGLGLPRSGGNVVTDALHFEGALIHLLALRREGLDVRLVLPRDWRTELRDLERAVDRKTKLNRGK